MAEIDEVLRVKEEIHDFIDDNFDGEEILRLLSALSMIIIETGYDAGIEHMDVVNLFVRLTNNHIESVSGPSEDDVIH